MNRIRIALASALAAVILVAFTLVWVNMGATVARALGDCRSVHVLQDAAKQRGDANEAYYRAVEMQACEGRDVTSTPSTSSTSSSSLTSPSVSSSSTSTTMKPAAKPTEPPYVFYAEYSDKADIFNFGPKVTMDPSLQSMQMKEMSDSQSRLELKYRYHRDPMLTAATGCRFVLWSCSDSSLQSKTARFVKDPQAWKSAKAAIDHKVDGQSSQIISLPAGWYYSTYALNAEAFPKVYGSKVYHSTDLQMIRFADGAMFRLHCGFQPYWFPKKAPKPAGMPRQLPKPAPGMTRTQEGVPVRKHPAPKPSVSSSSTTPPGVPSSSSTTTPPPSSTSSSSTTTPPPSSTVPPKCPKDTKDKACYTPPPGVIKPTNNPPSLEPSPTHSGPTLSPTSSSAPSPTATRTITVQPTETGAPGPTDPASGDPLG